MPTEPPWLLSALRDLGVREAPGVADNARVVAYHAVTDGGESPDTIPWCSSAACFHMERGGHRSTRSKAARSWLKWGEVLDAPRLGAVTILSRGTNPAQGHVGFWIAGDRDLCWLCGGNQGDAFTIASFARSRVLGWRWPVAA